MNALHVLITRISNQNYFIYVVWLFIRKSNVLLTQVVLEVHNQPLTYAALTLMTTQHPIERTKRFSKHWPLSWLVDQVRIMGLLVWLPGSWVSSNLYHPYHHRLFPWIGSTRVRPWLCTSRRMTTFFSRQPDCPSLLRQSPNLQAYQHFCWNSYLMDLMSSLLGRGFATGI